MPAHSKFSQELFDSICERIAQGEPLAVICRDPNIPITKRLFDMWCEADPELRKKKHAARDDGHDAIAHRARETARGSGDSSGDVQRDKLIVDTDLKLLAKWDGRYRDRQALEHSGPDGGPMQFQRVEIVAVEPQ